MPSAFHEFPRLCVALRATARHGAHAQATRDTAATFMLVGFLARFEHLRYSLGQFL